MEVEGQLCFAFARKRLLDDQDGEARRRRAEEVSRAPWAEEESEEVQLEEEEHQVEARACCSSWRRRG